MIPLFKVYMAREAILDLQDTLYSGQLAQGPKVDEFERALVPWMGTDSLVTVNSGTAALHLALRTLSLGPGDEVITTPLTCVATNWPILEAGADIVWADVDPRNCNIDPISVASKITERTRAIVAVHWGGYPCDLEALRAAAGEIPIIEDAAHALGARLHGRRIGSSGNFCAFSFQAIKLLTTGDGGCLTLPRRGLQRAKKLRWFGIDREVNSVIPSHRQMIDYWGDKLHMNDIAATIGLSQLPEVAWRLERAQAVSARYDRELANCPGLTLLTREPGFESACWLYTMLADGRTDLIRKLKSAGVAADLVHLRNDRHPCVRHFEAHLPQLDTIYPRRLCIPCGWWVSDEDQTHIIQTIKAGW